MGGLRLIAQPLVVTFAVRLWVLDNGQSILNADGVAQSTDGFCAAPKVAELPVTRCIDRRPDNVIMDMGLVNVGTNDKGVFALGEPLGKFHAQPVGFLRGNLPRTEGLANMVGNHIVCAPNPSGGSDILALCQHELGVGHMAVALIAGDEPAVVGLLRVGHIVNNRADGTTLGPTLADMQRHDACGCHYYDTSFERKQRPAKTDRCSIIFNIRLCIEVRKNTVANEMKYRLSCLNGLLSTKLFYAI